MNNPKKLEQTSEASAKFSSVPNKAISVKDRVLQARGAHARAIRCVAELEQNRASRALPWRRAALSVPQAIHDPAQTMEQQGLIARQPHKTPECARLHITDVGREALPRRRGSSRSCRGQDLRGFLQAGDGGFRAFLSRFVVRSIGIANQPWCGEDATSRTSLAARRRTIGRSSRGAVYAAEGRLAAGDGDDQRQPAPESRRAARNKEPIRRHIAVLLRPRNKRSLEKRTIGTWSHPAGCRGCGEMQRALRSGG